MKKTSLTWCQNIPVNNHQSLPGEGSSSLVGLTRGDLVLLDDDNTGESVQASGWAAGTVERTGDRGDFPAETVYVLPCVNRPPDDILVRHFRGITDLGFKLCSRGLFVKRRMSAGSIFCLMFLYIFNRTEYDFMIHTYHMEKYKYCSFVFQCEEQVTIYSNIFMSDHKGEKWPPHLNGCFTPICIPS